MGLLSKVAAFQSNSDEIVRKKKNLIESFFLDAKQLSSGFEYSTSLFDLFCKSLKITKGALLIPVITDDKRIKLFKQYFSIREFSAMDSIILVPFYTEGVINALLFIINPNDEKVEIAREISLKSEKLIVKLLKYRKPFTSLAVEENNNILNPLQILEEFLEKDITEDQIILVVTMQIRNLKNAIIKLFPNTDSFELSNNIVLSIKRLISNSGKLIELSSDKYLLFYKIKSSTTPGLIIHQIKVAISSFFNLSVNLPDIETNIKTYPAASNHSAEFILEGII